MMNSKFHIGERVLIMVGEYEGYRGIIKKFWYPEEYKPSEDRGVLYNVGIINCPISDRTCKTFESVPLFESDLKKLILYCLNFLLIYYYNE